MKQTAVEWLIEQIYYTDVKITRGLIKKAKEMEKQQIEMAFRKGFITEQWDKNYENKSEQYYNETFKNTKE
jgi:hypothetical protein